jgi:hypothetical protein
MRRPLALSIVALGVLIACDEPVEPPTTGSIAVQLVVPEPEVSDPASAALRLSDATGGARSGKGTLPGESDLIGENVSEGKRAGPLDPRPTLDVAGHLTKGRVVLLSGTSTVRDTSINLGASGGTVRLSQVTPGTYSVLVYGLVAGDSVDYFARMDAVVVTAGATARPTLSFQSFRPTLRDFITPTYAFKVRANFPPVPNATGYQVEWAPTVSFTGSSTASVTDTTYLMTLSDTGTYYTRVFAQAASVPNPRPSDVKSFRVLADTMGNTSAQAANLRALAGSSGVGAFSSTVTGLNVFPAADADWFKVRACTFDRLQVETRAARLVPPSTLNTIIRVFTSTNTTSPIVENDNLHVDTTDSRVDVVLPSQDSFRIQVASAGGNTVGHYELRVQLQKGPQNQDTNCVQTPALSKSVVTVSPATIQAGGTSTFTLIARDTAGVQIPRGGSAVAFSLSGGGTSSGVIGPVTDHGDGTYSATFTGQTAGTATEVSATIDGQSLSSAKPTITVTVGPAARAQFVVEPAGATAGTVIQPDVKVGVADAYGNLLTTATGVVTLTILNNPAGGTLFGIVSRTLVSGTGIATFSDLRIDRAGDGYTLRAGSGTLAPDTSAAFSITAGAAARLAFSVQPSNALPGIALAPPPEVQVQDAFGNRVAGAVNQITVSIANNPVGGVLSGTNVLNSADGVAVFGDLSIDKIGTGYTLKAKSPGLDSAVSNAFNVNIGNPAKLEVTGQPSNTSAGQTISPAITVAIKDAGGNLVSTAEDSVFIAIGTDPSGTATLSGTRRVKAVSGVATFNNLSINRSGSGYTLVVTSGSLTPDTTATFNISAGTKFKLAFSVPPSTTVSNSYMSPAPEVVVQDAFGNTVTSATDLVTVAIGTNPGGGTLLGQTTRAAAGGAARFDSLSINAAGTGYTLTATSGSLVSVTSAAFNIDPSPEVDPVRSTASASPDLGVVANGTDSTIITVALRDPAGNPIPGQSVQLAVTGTNNTLTQPAASTNASGITTGRLKSTRAETKTITVTVNPGPNQVVLSQQPTAQFVADTTTISASLSTAAANPASPDSVAGDGVQVSTITVTVRDANSNPVSGQTVQLATTGAGNLAQPGTTSASGVAMGSITRNSGGLDTITATVNPSGTAVVLTQRPVVKFFATSCGDPNATTSTVTVSPDTVAATGTDSSTVTVTVLDCGSSPVSGATVRLALSGSGNFVRQPTTTTDGSGVTTGRVSSTVAGSKTVTATINPGATQRIIVQKPAVVFRPGAPAALAFTVQPPSTTAGSVMSPSVQVAIVDNLGNVVDTATATVTLAVASGPDTLSGTKSVAASGGLAEFSDLFIRTAASGYTLSAGTSAYGGLGVTSSSFAIAAGSASDLVFSKQPSNITAGQTMDTVRVRVTDAFGNTVTSPARTVTLAIGTNPGGGTLLGTPARLTVSGIAAFTNLSVDKAGTGYTLTASATGLTPDTSNAFNVMAGAPRRLAFAVEPSHRTAGQRITPPVQVQVQDSLGNAVTSDVGLVTITIASDPSGSATLSGNASKNAVAGIATFDSLSLDKAANGYTLLAARTGLTPDTSVTFNITPAGATQLAFTTQPASTPAGSAITPAVRVTARDEFGNTATSFNDSITVAIGNNAGGGTLSGTRKVAAVAGIATFSGLSIDKTGAGYTLTAVATGLTGATSNGFDITAAVASKLEFTVQPTTTAAGVNISPAIQVAVKDAFGNTVAGATNAISLAILANPAAGSLIGTTTVSATSGVASFSAVTVEKAGAGYTLLATATGLGSDTSDAFTVTAGAVSASLSEVTANPATGVFADSVQTSTITVVVKDAFGNPVANKAVTLTASGTGNILTQPASNTNGAGTTSGSIASTVAETKTITATVDGSFVLAQQPTVAFIPDTGVSATQSLVSASPGNVVADGSTEATVTVTVRDKFGNPVSGQTVQIAASGSSNTITQPGAATNASGVATGTVRSTKAEMKTITVTVNPGAGQKVLVQEPTVLFEPGPAAKVKFVTQPSSAVAGASIGPAVEVAVVDAFDNTVGTATNDIVLRITGGDAGARLRGDTTNAAVSGVASFADLSVDSAAASYRLVAKSTGLADDTSAVFDVLVGPPDSVYVSPAVDSIFTLGETRQFTAQAFDSVGNLIPDAVFTWMSSNEPVATVDATGRVTAQARGLATITAQTDGVLADADLAVALRLLTIIPDYGLGLAPSQIFSSGDVPGTLTSMDVTTFNATAPAVLRASYDVLLVEWGTNASADLGWTARIVPFLEAGGGIVWEDPYNVSDLAPGVIGLNDETDPSAGGFALLDVPGMTAGIASDFTNSHTTFTDWSDSLVHFVLQGNKALAVYGRIGAGCIVLNGPDVGWHGDREDVGTHRNEYDLFLRQVLFAADCPLNATPGAPVAVRVFPPSVSFTDAGQAQQLRATALDDAGTPVIGASITWTTLNESVATVDGTGLVTSQRSGQVSIQAAGSGADYAVASVAEPSAVAVNAWGTEVAAGFTPSYLMKIWATGPDNLFAVGDGGQIRRFNGVDWDTLSSGGSPNWLWGVWGSSATDVYAVGWGGTVLHSMGGDFSVQPDPSGAAVDFYSVWGSGPNDVFVVGAGGKIFHWDGTNWGEMVSGTTNLLYAVWGTAWNNVFAGGQGGVILHYDGVSWEPASGSPVSFEVHAIAGSGPDNVFAVGSGSQVARFDGLNWYSQAIPSSANLYDVWVASQNEAIAVGFRQILKYDGSTWTPMANAAPGWILGVWGIADGQLRAVGQTGEVWRGVRGAVATSAQVTPLGTTVSTVGATTTFTAKAYDDSRNVVTLSTPFTWSSENVAVATVAAGTGVATAQSSGQVAIRATSTSLTAYGLLTVAATGSPAVDAWSTMITPTTTALWDVWGASNSFAVAVGNTGTIVRYNGTSWTLDPQSGVITTAQLFSASGTSASDIHAVGGSETLLRFSGTTWSSLSVPLPGTQTIWRVWAAAPNAAYAVSSGGYVIRFNGTAWDTLPRLASSNLIGIWGSSTSDVFAVGSSGVIVHFNGTDWDTLPSPLGTEQLNAVWGTASNNVYVVGQTGTVIHYNGSSWTVLAAQPGLGFSWDIWGTSGSEVYVGSNGGAVSRYNGVSWTTMLSGAGGAIRGLWGTSTGTVYAVNESTVPIRRGVRGAPLMNYGYPSDFGSNGTFSPNYLLGELITVGDTLEMTHFGIISGAVSSQVKLGLYADVAGTPGALLAQSSGAMTAGTLLFPVTQTRLLPGSYWIMAVYDVTSSPRVNATFTNTIKYISHSFANALPGSFPAHTTYTGQYFNYYVRGFRF